MTPILLFATILMAASFYGWGAAVRLALKLATPRPTNLVLGVAFITIMGGGLICFSTVNSGVIFGLLFVGVVIAVFDALQAKRRGMGGTHWRHYLSVIAAAPLVFWVHHRPTAFNIHDDIEKYLKYPGRLLATGNLDTGPFDALGAEALGGMSFLQSFALVTGPLAFVSVIDDVIGLLMVVALVGALGSRLNVSWGISLAVGGLMIVIDPLKANTSTTYIGAALIMGVFIIALAGKSEEVDLSTGQALAIGLLCAALVTLKTSLALVLPLLFAALVIPGIALAPDRRRFLGKSSLIPLAAVGLAAPWFMAHAEKFGTWWRHGPPAEGAALTESAKPPRWEPFSTDPMDFGFGVGHAHYSALVVIFFGIGVWFLAGAKNESPRRRWIAGAIGIGVAINYLAGQGLAAARLVGYDNGLRYQLPLLLTGILLLLWVGMRPSHEQSVAPAPRGERWRSWSGVVILVAFIALFSTSFFNRYQQGLKWGFTREVGTRNMGDYLEYHAFLRGTVARELMQTVQAQVPAGERLLVWTTLGAFHLDYARNPIWDVDPAGLAGPWQPLPLGGPTTDQLAILQQQGIRYVVWQYAGPGVRDDAYLATMLNTGFERDRKIFGRTLLFRNLLRELSSQPQWAETIYDDETTRVPRLRSGL